jgi:hypothetical protein
MNPKPIKKEAEKPTLGPPIGIQIVFLFLGFLLYGAIIQRPC